MSNESYDKWWIVTKRQLEELRAYEEAKRKKMKEPVQDRYRAVRILGDLYARYSMVVQELDLCLDQMCQVNKDEDEQKKKSSTSSSIQAQQRYTARKIMDAAAIRLKELKDEMVRAEYSEFQYIDGNLVELKLIPHDVEILTPKLFFHRQLDVWNLVDMFKVGLVSSGIV